MCVCPEFGHDEDVLVFENLPGREGIRNFDWQSRSPLRFLSLRPGRLAIISHREAIVNKQENPVVKRMKKSVKNQLTDRNPCGIITKLSLRSEAEGRRGRRKSGGSV